MFDRNMQLQQHIKQHNGRYLSQAIIAVVVISIILSQVTGYWLDESLIIDKDIERVHVKYLFLYGFPVLGLSLLLLGSFSGQSVVYHKACILMIVSIVATINTLSISMFSDISIISVMMITLIAKLLVFSPLFSLFVYSTYIYQSNMMVEIFHADMVLYANYYFSLAAMFIWLNYISINNYRSFVRDYNHEQKKKSWMATAIIHNREIAAKNVILNGYSYVDEVTGLHNRRYLQQQMALLNQRTFPLPLGVLLIDIDHFKQVNDVYGHVKGDEYLKKVSQAMRNVFKRKSDVIARYGGEEIVVMLTGITQQDLENKAKQACEAVRALALQHPLRECVSVSIGGIYASTDHYPAEHYLDSADNCMYEVKSRGRNGYLVQSL